MLSNSWNIPGVGKRISMFLGGMFAEVVDLQKWIFYLNVKAL